MSNFTIPFWMMKNRHKHPLPFLVTLAGCVLMLAWVDPANATEVTRQLTQKGYAISQLRKGDVAIVKNSHNDLRVVFNVFNSSGTPEQFESGAFIEKNSADYHFVFPRFVKSLLQADIRTWRKRE